MSISRKHRIQVDEEEEIKLEMIESYNTGNDL